MRLRVTAQPSAFGTKMPAFGPSSDGWPEDSEGEDPPAARSPLGAYKFVIAPPGHPESGGE